MKAILVNASPRKNRNTATILERVREGLEAGGCETRTVHLGMLSFTGCKGCLACKAKGSKCNGLCALRDDLRPVLEEVLAADVLVLGSPVYFHAPTASARAFTERLLFPALNYGEPDKPVLRKPLRTAVVYTMHVADDGVFAQFGYEKTLGFTARAFEMLGPQETQYFRGLSTFPDRERFVTNAPMEEVFARIRREDYPAYEERARDLGRRLAAGTARTEAWPAARA